MEGPICTAYPLQHQPIQKLTFAQAPALLLGHTVAAIGSGLLTTLTTSTPNRLWILFMVLSGAGTGMVENTPYIAIQAALNRYAFSLRSRRIFQIRISPRFALDIEMLLT